MNESSSLSKVVKVNNIINYVIRACGIVLGLAYTRFTLNYLGSSLFGIWSTIASIASWINFGDLGIGNGLRNELAKAFALNDTIKQKKLIATSVKTLSFLSLFLFFSLIAITEILFATGVLESSIRIPMYITNFFFCLDLVFGVGRAIAYGLQKSWITTLAQVLTVLLRVVTIIVLIIFPHDGPSLVVFSIANGVCGTITNIIALIVIFIKLKWKRISSLNKYYDRNERKGIVNIGVQFFILQIACLILYATDNLIIQRLISSEAVTEYSIISKIYTTGENLFSILLITFWSAVTAAAANRDFLWIEKETKKLVSYWGIFSVGVVLVSIFLNILIKIWLGDNAVYYNISMILLFCFYTILTTFGSIFVNISNGLGRIKYQLIFSIIGAIVNIPLSIIFATSLNMGIFGVKLATLICCVGTFTFIPFDIVNYVRKKKGEQMT